MRGPRRPERRPGERSTSPATGRTYPLRSLWQLDLPTYEPGPATCPRCADGTPLHAPGSSGTGVAAGASAPDDASMDRRTRNLFALVLVVVIGRLAARRSARWRPAATPAIATRRSAIGVIVGVDSEGLDEVRGFTLRTDGRRDRRRSRVGALENGVEFPPGHLVEHQATAQPVRVWYRTEGETRVAIRLEDAPCERRADRRQPPALLISARTASSSASETITSNEPWTIPVAVDDEDPRLGRAGPTGS